MGPRRTTLPSGATVVSERVPGVASAAFGLYFPTGSRHETPSTNGISHFIEHLVFKGTPTRSADDINREIDALGGASNAYTTKESLCLHARVLAEHVPRLVEFYADLATHALPEGLEAEVERERQVILSEIGAVEDSPEDLLGSLADDAVYGAHPLGLPVVGSAPAVQRLALPEIRDHFRRHIVARDLVVAAAGDIDHDVLVELSERHLSTMALGDSRERAVAPPTRPATRVLERDLEQVHVVLSGLGLAARDPRWAAAEVLCVIVGEGYSSRLFREVRDRRGLVYSVYSSLTTYTDTGSFDVDFTVAPAKLAETLDVVGRVLGSVRDGDVTEEEVANAKAYLRGNVLLGHETPSARMAYVAEQVLLGEESLDIGRDLAAIAAVELADVRALAAELLCPSLALAAVGPASTATFGKAGWEIPT